MKNIVTAFMLTLIAVCTFAFAFNVRPAKASGTIYIRADGSIDPPTAPISTVDQVTYTLTGSIFSDADGIVVERNYIVIDGVGYAVQGPGANVSKGIDLTSRMNVTVRNTQIRSFGVGIWLLSSSWSSVRGNNVTANSNYGIWLAASSNNVLVGNNLADNMYGIWFSSSSYNNVSGNTVTDSDHGIWLDYYSNYNWVSGNIITANNVFGITLQVYSSDNALVGNSIVANGYGIYLIDSSENAICHNSFIDNTIAQASSPLSGNIWDYGYPLGGNYWSDYSGTDLFSGPSQGEPGRDGIGDTPYVIDTNDADNYPLMGVFTPSGEDIAVSPAQDVCVTYETVTLEGLTNVEKPVMGPAPPPGSTVKQYYIIETTADYAGNISIRIICNMSLGARGDAPLQEGWQLLQCIMLAGDVDEDFNVDIFDIVLLAGAYGTSPPNPKYSPKCDIDGDGDVDIFDLVRAAGNYGEVWDPATGWSDITTRVDEGSNSIFGVTRHLSIFGVTRG